MFAKLFRNSQLRLLLSGTLFASAFIWMAVTSYGVSQAEIKVFLIFSFLLVSLLIVGGLLCSVLVRFFRRGKAGLLAQIEQDAQDIQ